MITPITNEAYKLVHQGILALSQVEHNGLRVDVQYLTSMISEIDETIRTLTKEIKKDDIYKQWRRRFGSKTKLGSTQQLSKIIYDDLKYEATTFTKTGLPKTDEKALSQIDLPFIQNYLEIKKLKKVKTTYLMGILKETRKGRLHPVFNLHLAVTYRSSSDSPNFQNLPIRSPEMGKIVRQCFIPRPNHHIVEVDYSSIEVHAATWYHHDPTMIEYLNDDSKDMHRDMSQQCYMLSEDEMTPRDGNDAKRIKAIRSCGKNAFVFPQFYGSWYRSCAFNLWEQMLQYDLRLRDGTPIQEHLENNGITRLHDEKGNVYRPQEGTYMHHLKEIEYDFWYRRFRQYQAWKDRTYAEYNQKGEYKTLTGFMLRGYLSRNDITNYPVQGVAFHCLLWSLIRIQKILQKRKMKSLIVGQIHDSIVADVHTDELQDYLKIANKVMTYDIKKHWKWITTPIQIEAEVADVNKSWYEKKPVKIG